ncbi:MAG: nuclease A inhibitor family protein [bacterium]
MTTWHSTELCAAASGLLYTSEGDAPFEEVFIALGAATWPLRAVQFLRIIAEVPDVKVEERTLDEFFARHLERADPLDEKMQALRPRFEFLREMLRAKLRDVRVFRVGAVEVRCYVVGADTVGNLAGLVTTAFES